MSSSRRYFFKSVWHYLKPYTFYFLSFIAVTAFLFAGTRGSNINGGDKPIMRAITNPDFSVSMDTLSESYLVSSFADSMGIPSSNFISQNFVTISTLYEYGAIDGSRADISMINVIDTSNLNHGIAVEYVFKEGDTLKAIADRYGVSTTDIRWSNSLKNDTIAVGTTLYIPTRPGILYTVKGSDSLDSIISKYKTNRDEVIAFNNLDTQEFKAGITILLTGGELPEKERPEYVPPAPPVRQPIANNYVTSGSGGSQRGPWRLIDTYNAIVKREGNKWYVRDNPGGAGQCVWFAWYWRNKQVDLGNLPSHYRISGGRVGHGYQWANNRKAEGFIVNRTPAWGAVAQTPGDPYYGHVGIVTNVYDNGDVEITEMNWFGWGRVTVSVAPASAAKNFWYIHGKK